MNEATILVHQRAFFVVVVDTYNWHSVERLVPRQLHGFDDLPVQLPLLNRFTAVAADVVATYTRRPAARFIIEGTEKRNTHNTQQLQSNDETTEQNTNMWQHNDEVQSISEWSF